MLTLRKNCSEAIKTMILSKISIKIFKLHNMSKQIGTTIKVLSFKNKKNLNVQIYILKLSMKSLSKSSNKANKQTIESKSVIKTKI